MIALALDCEAMGRLLAVGATSALLAAVVATVSYRIAPAPSAEVARGTEEAFASGLYPRELPPRSAPLRWTTDHATICFRFVPAGRAHLVVRLRQHRTRVLVLVAGGIVGALEPHEPTFETDLETKGRVTVQLTTEGFVAGGRRLGASLDSVTLTPERGLVPSVALLACFIVPAVVVGVGALGAPVPAPVAALYALSVSLAQGFLLVPSGVLFSRESVVLGALFAVLGLVAVLFSRGRGGACCLALLLAVVVHGGCARSPQMIVSDAVLQANKLTAVAHGEFFPTSETQHTPPFRFPYGVSFFALLAPLARLGCDPVALVRWGAALSGLGAAFALLRLLAPRGALWAGAAVGLLQILPGSFDLYSYGNLSNVFAQSMTVLFFAWWAGAAPGGAAVGALLVVLAALGHLSSFFVLLVVGVCLAVMGGHDLRQDRTRRAALLIGLGLSVLYYLCFVPLVLSEIHRLGEGGAGGSAAGTLLVQLRSVRLQWGLPILPLALLGFLRRVAGSLDKDALAFWIAGLVLAFGALVSPLEVRYLYALTLPLVIAAGRGVAATLEEAPVAPRIGVLLLVLLQAWVAFREIGFDLFTRYRPAG